MKTFSARGAGCVMVMVVRNGHSEPSSNPEWNCLHFTLLEYPGERYKSNYSSSSYGWIVEQTVLFSLGLATNLGEGKLWIQTC